MAKIPVGVGPKLPQVVVLFGATGDRAKRKLLPGLFHLVVGGFIPDCRIIGVSLDDIDVEGFRALAKQALTTYRHGGPGENAWPAFSALLDYVPLSAGPAGLKEAVESRVQVRLGLARHRGQKSVRKLPSDRRAHLCYRFGRAQPVEARHQRGV